MQIPDQDSLFSDGGFVRDPNIHTGHLRALDQRGKEKPSAAQEVPRSFLSDGLGDEGCWDSGLYFINMGYMSMYQLLPAINTATWHALTEVSIMVSRRSGP